MAWAGIGVVILAQAACLDAPTVDEGCRECGVTEAGPDDEVGGSSDEGLGSESGSESESDSGSTGSDAEGPDETDDVDGTETDGGDPVPTYDDPLVHTALGHGHEIVGLEYDGERYAITCGGFGGRVDDLIDPDSPGDVGWIEARCQNAAFGPGFPDGSRVVYVTHHGDSFVGAPFLSATRISGDPAYFPDDISGNFLELSKIEDPESLFEGLAWRDDVLAVVEHLDGLELFATGPDGALTGAVPEPLATLGGLGNAIEVEFGPDGFLYVADADGAVHTIDVADPSAPVLLGTTPTVGSARDLDFDDGQLFVALGGDGVASYSLADPAVPELVDQVVMAGSAQGVDADGPYLAVASWTYSAVLDADTLELLATENVTPFPDFEQDLDIALDGTRVMVGEWEGLHLLEYQVGVTAPDAWIDEDLYAFDLDEASDRVIVIENRGQEELVVSDIAALDLAYSILADLPMHIPPGGKGAFEIAYQPPSLETALLVVTTNDPDLYHSSYQKTLLAHDAWNLTVGDQLTEDYAFLDPQGLAGLEGNVTILAYFALF